MANAKNTKPQISSETMKILGGNVSKYASKLALHMSAVTKVMTVMTASIVLLHSPDPKKREEAAKFLNEIHEFQRQNYLEKTPFEKTKMSKRTQNVLKKAGFTSLVEVDKLSATELLALTGVGKKRAMEILTEGTKNYKVRNEFIKD